MMNPEPDSRGQSKAPEGGVRRVFVPRLAQWFGKFCQDEEFFTRRPDRESIETFRLRNPLQI